MEKRWAKGAPAPLETEWREIDGFRAYEISSNGQVRNIETGLVLKSEVGHRGHLRVTLFNERGPKRHLVHRLVLLHFIGEPPSSSHECAHWDGNAANNFVGNLRWATRKENYADMRRHGRVYIGERSHFAKLSEGQAINIRHRLVAGETVQSLAKALGLNLSTINRIAIGTGWSHLGAAPRRKRLRKPVDDATAEAAVAAVRGGHSISQASRDHGLSRQSIRRRFDREILAGAVHATI